MAMVATAPTDTRNTAGALTAATAKTRDLRLDFFRGLAMFIILLAHTPGNTWTLWIPARFGFSDATEIFVFCSGMASALAFGTVFMRKGWHLGAARVMFRVWQVYWAHIGVFLVTAAVLYGVDVLELGVADKVYSNWSSVKPLHDRTGETLLGLMTLTYIPGLFNILPMYLVILAMIPVVMLIAREGGVRLALGGLLVLYLLTQCADIAMRYPVSETSFALHHLVATIGSPFHFLNLPALPWSERAVWFFNPFGWQLVFFTGFALGIGWIKPPPVDPRLIWAAAAFVVLTIPLAWFQLHGGNWPGGRYLPVDWKITQMIRGLIDLIEPAKNKTPLGPLRWLHFIALAYLAWVAVGTKGCRLVDGWHSAWVPENQRRIVFLAAILLCIATFPYAFHWELRGFAPGFYDSIMLLWPSVPDNRIGTLMLLFLAALLTAVWQGGTEDFRQAILGRWFTGIVPVIRKVGTQSLAVFLVSLVVARIDGLMIEHLGYWSRDVQNLDMAGTRSVLTWGRFLINGFGFACLIGTAYLVGWFKSQPWREERS